MGAERERVTINDETAARLVQSSEKTREAIEELSGSFDERDELHEARHKALVAQHHELRREVGRLATILVGKRGDNGLTARVATIERSGGTVSWQTVLTLITLAIALAAVFVAL